MLDGKITTISSSASSPVTFTLSDVHQAGDSGSCLAHLWFPSTSKGNTVVFNYTYSRRDNIQPFAANPQILAALAPSGSAAAPSTATATVTATATATTTVVPDVGGLTPGAAAGVSAGLTAAVFSLVIMAMAWLLWKRKQDLKLARNSYRPSFEVQDPSIAVLEGFANPRAAEVASRHSLGGNELRADSRQEIDGGYWRAEKAGSRGSDSRCRIEKAVRDSNGRFAVEKAMRDLDGRFKPKTPRHEMA